MGQVGIPAHQARAGRFRRQHPREHGVVLEPEAPATPAEVVIAHPEPARPHHKAHEAGAIAAATDLGFHRMGPQTQGCKLLLHLAAGPAQGFGVIRKKGQIIHITQVGLHARQGTEGVVEPIEVHIG